MMTEALLQLDMSPYMILILIMVQMIFLLGLAVGGRWVPIVLRAASKRNSGFPPPVLLPTGDGIGFTVGLIANTTRWFGSASW